VTEYLNPLLNTLGDNLPQKRSLECGSFRFLPKFRASSGKVLFRVLTLTKKSKSLDPNFNHIAIDFYTAIQNIYWQHFMLIVAIVEQSQCCR